MEECNFSEPVSGKQEFSNTNRTISNLTSESEGRSMIQGWESILHTLSFFFFFSNEAKKERELSSDSTSIYCPGHNRNINTLERTWILKTWGEDKTFNRCWKGLGLGQRAESHQVGLCTGTSDRTFRTDTI